MIHPDARAWMIRKVDAELGRAYTKHGSMPWSRHEFYAILLEEVEELWDAIKQDQPEHRVLEETVQVAAMCFRFIETGTRHGEFNKTHDLR